MGYGVLLMGAAGEWLFAGHSEMWWAAAVIVLRTGPFQVVDWSIFAFVAPSHCTQGFFLTKNLQCAVDNIAGENL